jgi:hypothetical protein
MELDGVVQNGVIVPQSECALPEGTRVRIEAIPPDEGAAVEPAIWQKLFRLGQKAKQRTTNLPIDLAENHDHYIHGRPKRS